MIYETDNPATAQYLLNLSKQQPITREPAGLGESLMQDLGMIWRETHSISRDVALSAPRAERTQRIREIAGEKAFIKALTLSGDPETQAMIDALAAEHPEIETDVHMMDRIRERNRGLREERDIALQHQTTGGRIGSLLGTMIGAMSDPLVLGTLPLGAGWATGVLRTALIEAGIAAGTEALIQLAIYRYKQELESPYDMSDVLINVGGAAVGAGVLTGAVKATARALSKWGRAVDAPPPRVAGYDEISEAAERIPNPMEEQKAAMETLRAHADSLRQSPFAIEHPQLDELHLSALAKATDDIANGRPVDVSEFIEQPPTVPRAAAVVDDLDAEEAVGRIAQGKQAQDLLAAEDMQIPVEIEGGGTVMRSAREVLQELDEDAKAAAAVKACMVG